MIVTTVEQLSNINNIISCTICKEVFRAPVITSTCHHVFCSVCIRRSLNQGLKYCPICNTALFEANLSKCTIVEDIALWFSDWIVYNKDQNQQQMINQQQVTCNDNKNYAVQNDRNNSRIQTVQNESNIEQNIDQKYSSGDLETNSSAGRYFYISRKLTDPKRNNSSKFNTSPVEAKKTITGLLQNKKSRSSDKDSKSVTETSSTIRVMDNSDNPNDNEIVVIDLAEEIDNNSSQIEGSSINEINIINEVSSLPENEVIEISSQEQLNSDNLGSNKRRRLNGFLQVENSRDVAPSFEVIGDREDGQDDHQDVASVNNNVESAKEVSSNIETNNKFHESEQPSPKLECASNNVESNNSNNRSDSIMHNTDFIEEKHQDKDIQSEVHTTDSNHEIHDQLVEESDLLSGIRVIKVADGVNNQHSIINKQNKIPKIDLSKLNVSKIKEKFKQHHIPLPTKYPDFSKSKINATAMKEQKYLQKYFNQYYILWNSNLDTEFQISKAEIINQMKEWERIQILQEHNSAMKRDFSEIKKVDPSAWIIKYKDEFRALISIAKSSRVTHAVSNRHESESTT